MKKTFFYSLFALTAWLIFAQSTPAEARGHRHHHYSTGVQLNVGGCHHCHDAYVVQRYARPIPVVYAPAYPYPYYQPMAYQAVVPAYVEEVQVVPVRRSPFSFAGLSFSWNLFR